MTQIDSLSLLTAITEITEHKPCMLAGNSGKKPKNVTVSYKINLQKCEKNETKNKYSNTHY